jgi:hypothetical protein
MLSRPRSSTSSDVTAGTTAPTLLSWLVEFGSSSNKGATLSGVGIVTDFSIKGGLDLGRDRQHHREVVGLGQLHRRGLIHE